MLNNKLLEILEDYKQEKKHIDYKDLMELLKTDESIIFFVNLSMSAIRVYSKRFNCHIYNIIFDELDDYDFIIIKDIVRV